MKKTLGTLIAELRKQRGMTQLELAGMLGVTDKAVSKWERDLSCPDINTLPALAEALGVTLEELMEGKSARDAGPSPVLQTADTVCKAVALAMGVAVAVLTVLKAVDTGTAVGMLGLGLACLALSALQRDHAGS